MNLLIFLSLFLLNFSILFSQNNKLDLARKLYHSSIKNEDDLIKAIEIFHQISAENPNLKPLSNTYIGSLTMIKGKHAFWPHKKVEYVNEGLKIMDKAIKEDPDNIEILFIYGSSCYYLPFFFNKKNIAISKFRQIINLLDDKNIKEYDNEILTNALEFIKNNIELSKNELQKVDKFLNLLSTNNG